MPSATAYAEAGAIAAQNCSPATDMRGSAEYKRHLADELTQPGPRAERSSGPGRGGLRVQVSMTVNGDEVTEEIEGRLLLVHFLRDQLGLTGTHWGCDTSNCGTCVVWLDGEPVKSCTVLAAMAGGHEVRTVEGLERTGSSTRSNRASWRATGSSAGFARPA